MSVNSTKITKSVTLIPEASSVVSEKGEIAYNSATDKIEAFTGSASSNLVTSSYTGDTTSTGNHTQNGNETVTGTLGVTGTTTLGAALTVNANETVTGTLAVSGTTTLGAALTVNANETVTGNLSVSGNETVVGAVSVSGLTTVTDTLAFASNSNILSGSTDPSATAVSAPKGSLYLNSASGTVYRKNDSGSSTNWSQFAVVGSGSSEFAAIVANPAIAGFSTHTSITAAIAAVTAGQQVLVTNGTYAEDVTIDKQIHLEGYGRGTCISGNLTFNASGILATVNDLKFTGNLTFNSGATGNIVDNVFVLSTMVYTDSNTTDGQNFFQAMQE